MTLLNKIKNNKFLTYVLFAIFTTIVNVGVYLLVHEYIISSVLISNMCAYLCSITLSFIINKNIVFKSKGKIFIQIIMFLLVKFISFGIDSAILILLKDYLHVNNFIAKLISNASTTISNYFFNNKIVFKNK